MGKERMESVRTKQTPKTIGDCSQAYIMAKLLEIGYSVLTPFGDNQRYDLVIEDAEGQLWRVQLFCRLLS